jgi:hypothetical protein
MAVVPQAGVRPSDVLGLVGRTTCWSKPEGLAVFIAFATSPPLGSP